MKAVKLQFNRNLVFLLVALLIGVLAAVLAVSYVQRTVNARTAVAEEITMAVAVPTRDIPAGQILQPDDLAVRPVAPDLVPADVITPDNYEQHLAGCCAHRSVRAHRSVPPPWYRCTNSSPR